MNQAQALAKLGKVLGKNLGYRIDPKAPDAATRAGLYRHRVTVGVSQYGFFSVKAEGDNWDEVVAKVAGTDNLLVRT